MIPLISTQLRPLLGEHCKLTPSTRTATRHRTGMSCDRCLVSRVQLKCDGTRWRTAGEMKGKMANGVGSQYSSHYVGTCCIQHYYRWCAHLGCQWSTEMTTPWFKWTRPFRRKTKSGFCLCAITVQTQFKTTKFTHWSSDQTTSDILPTQVASHTRAGPGTLRVAQLYNDLSFFFTCAAFISHILFSVALSSQVGHGLLIVEVCWSHKTHHSR